MPSLRNVGLRRGLMHNGQRTTLQEILDFYGDPEQQHGDNVDPLLPIIATHDDVIIDFLENGLMDPRAAAEVFPFDRPRLASESATPVAALPPSAGGGLTVQPAFPNPFRALTTLSWSLTESRDVTVTLYDVSGRRVRRLLSGRQGPGDHRVTWDGQDRSGRRGSAGVFLFRVEAGTEVAHGRVVLAR